MSKSSALCFFLGLLIFISLGGEGIAIEVKQCLDKWLCGPGDNGDARCFEDCVLHHGTGALGDCQPNKANIPRTCYCTYYC
ncbi:hypothetical protein LINPERHAP1_LOCUS24097 [Linum perenne]